MMAELPVKQGKCEPLWEESSAHRDNIGIQNTLLGRHKLEVDCVCSWPQGVGGNQGRNKLLLQLCGHLACFALKDAGNQVE